MALSENIDKVKDNIVGLLDKYSRYTDFSVLFGLLNVQIWDALVLLGDDIGPTNDAIATPTELCKTDVK